MAESTTISAAAADNSFNDSASALAVLPIGEGVHVSGFADPANTGWFVVVTSTPAKLVVSGGTLVDEAAGQSVTIRSDVLNGMIQQLEADALIELFELDATGLGGSLFRFHAGTNAVLASITWQSNVYTPFPIEAEGFTFSGRGQLPRPTLRVANVDGLIGAEIAAYGDLVGAKLTRIRTLAKFLDGQPDADPTAEFPRDVYFVDRKAGENQVFVSFELASAFDVEGVMLPRRQVAANVCPWLYRGPECGYAGGAVAKLDDTPTSDPDEDACGKRLASCELRFGVQQPLPFGGFPGSNLVPR